MDKETIARFEREMKEIEERKRLIAPYERALGKLSIRFSLLHLMLEEFGWKVWGLDSQVGSILTKDLPTKHLVKKIRDSADLFIDKKSVRKEFLAILNRVEKVADRRNEFLHSIWLIRAGEPTLCISRKRGPLLDQEAPSAEDINDLSRIIMNVVTDFMEMEDGKSLLTRISESRAGMSLDQ